MYLYLYDSFLNDKKYSSLLAKIETRLTDLGIGGKIFRLSPLRNVSELINDEARAGAQTIVVVGNDKTFTQIINLAAKIDITIGIIPVGPDNKIATALGINSPENGCAVLASRTIEKIDLGKANGTYFLSSLTLSPGNVTIECEDQFKITPPPQQQISICNLKPATANGFGTTSYFNPKDGLLEILIQPLTPLVRGLGQLFRRSNSQNHSIIPFKKIAIRSRGSISILTDGQRILKTPVEIEIAPKKLKIIVGKDRIF
ncbi:MAG: diacylglycerol kinase family protein [Patescibacteria group bacterium]|nr:diacylglycerol kinase family protein [Patescibacteria group bacterium]